MLVFTIVMIISLSTLFLAIGVIYLRIHQKSIFNENADNTNNKISDIDGNSYRTVKIGDQLKTNNTWKLGRMGLNHFGFSIRCKKTFL